MTSSTAAGIKAGMTFDQSSDRNCCKIGRAHAATAMCGLAARTRNAVAVRSASEILLAVRCYIAEIPPSSLISEPVMNRVSSDAR